VLRFSYYGTVQLHQHCWFDVCENTAVAVNRDSLDNFAGLPTSMDQP